MQKNTETSSHSDLDISRETFRILVRSYDGMFNLIDKGNYKYVDPQIGLGTFPMESENLYYAEVVHVGLVGGYEHLRLGPALEELKERGLTPATAHELLAFGAQCADSGWVQHGFLSALGTVMQHKDVCEFRYVLTMRFGEKKDRKDLVLNRMESVDDSFSSAFSSANRFLVVRRKYIEESA